MTLPVLNAARHVMFIVAGEAKASALAQVLGYDDRGSAASVPAALVRPESGRLSWMVDCAAASGLEDAPRQSADQRSETYVEIYRPASHAELAVIRVRLKHAGIQHYVKNEFASLGSLSAIGVDQLILMAESRRAGEARRIARQDADSDDDGGQDT
jgi:hypothetical protein